MMISVDQRPLMLQALFALAKGIDAPSDGGDALTQVEIEPRHPSRIDLPATCRQHLANGLQGAKPDPVLPPPPAGAGTA